MKRTIEVSTKGMSLRVHDKCIEVRFNNDLCCRVHPEDLNLVVLGSNGVSVSAGALNALATAGVGMLSVDDKSQPNGLFLPFWSNSTHAERYRMLAATPEPVAKQLWAKIVAQKILNQSLVLSGEAEQRFLRRLSGEVKTGDATNLESQAAQYYWPRAFAKHIKEPFRRKPDGAPPNGLLNYGYAILRAAMARAICIAGMQPSLGIHHRNKYARFCLADDLMEPFRPYVDRIVLGLLADNKSEMDKEAKQRLLHVLSKDVFCGKEHFLLSYMIEKTASSFADCIAQKYKDKISAKQAASHLLLPRG
ncbi:MAG: type II CRISPR-associated endonuclease Cas1 [Deltaproteobacteria bacterium]|nr:type II CRISPR-associated endonuclease Cas1 [Deltaproteobacteria bacterium]